MINIIIKGSKTASSARYGAFDKKDLKQRVDQSYYFKF